MIAPTFRSRARRRDEERGDFARFEIFDEAWPRALERNRHDSLAEVQVLRIGRDEPREGVDRREPGVPCRHAVAALAFQMLEKGDDLLWRDVGEVESPTGSPRRAARKRSRSVNASR